MPDFGIFRGFNDKLFGDKLYAGQLPTQLGIIGSQEVSDFDADAEAFFIRVGNAGGTLSATEKTAVNTLVVQMKDDGIWTKMKAIYPMVGASSAACAQNLKSSSFVGVFNGGWTFANTGVAGNGTNGYFDTNFPIGIDLPSNNVSVSIYKKQIIANSLSSEYGIMDGSQHGIELIANYFGDMYATINEQTTDNPFTGSSTAGFYNINRLTSTTKKMFINGNLYQTRTSATRTNTIGSAPMIMSARAQTSGGVINLVQLYNSREVRFFSMGNGLTDDQSLLFYDAVQAFQTTLSRQV